MTHHDVDFQWGNHDVVWMGAAAGSPLCILHGAENDAGLQQWDMLEDGYGIPLRHLLRMAEQYYGNE